MTVVVDASVVAELLLGTERGFVAAPLLRDQPLIAPPHLETEVASVIRGWSLGGHVTEAEALQAFREFEQLGVEQIEMTSLLPEVWALRHNLTAYDAMYVVLARAVGCEVLTFDERMTAVAPDCAVVPQSA